MPICFLPLQLCLLCGFFLWCQASPGGRRLYRTQRRLWPGRRARLATAIKARPAYTGTASTNLRLGLMLSYRLSRNRSLFGGAGWRF